jgi:ABC-type transporter Mla subunit MlaD
MSELSEQIMAKLHAAEPPTFDELNEWEDKASILETKLKDGRKGLQDALSLIVHLLDAIESLFETNSLPIGDTLYRIRKILKETEEASDETE